MNHQYWSWILTAVGITGFILAGRKVWWAWYINIGCQALWFTYAIVTQQYGFIIAALLYTVVFTQNAIKWTRERHPVRKDDDILKEMVATGALSLNEAREIRIVRVSHSVTLEEAQQIILADDLKQQLAKDPTLPWDDNGPAHHPHMEY